MAALGIQDCANVRERERMYEVSRAEAHTRATNACGGGRFLVGPERIELSTDGLKVHCSTTELRAHQQYSRSLARTEERSNRLLHYSAIST